MWRNRAQCLDCDGFCWFWFFCCFVENRSSSCSRWRPEARRPPEVLSERVPGCKGQSAVYSSYKHISRLDSEPHHVSSLLCCNEIWCDPLQDLLYRRSRALVDYENANKALDKARAKNRDVLQAETTQQLCCHKFEKISESAKQGGIQIFTDPCKVPLYLFRMRLLQ